MKDKNEKEITWQLVGKGCEDGKGCFGRSLKEEHVQNMFYKIPPKINKNNAAKVDIYKRDNETFFVLAYTSHSDYTETLIFQSRTIVSGLGCWEIRDGTQICMHDLKFIETF